MKQFDALQVIQKFQTLRSARGNFDSLWQDIADYVQPTKNDIQTTSFAGERKYVNLLDTTAQTSNELLAGALHSMLTNPAGYFFGLSTGDLGLDQNDNVRKWIQKIVRILHDVLNQSNFQTEVHEQYLDLTSFGFAAMAMEEDPDSVVMFSSKPIREIYVDGTSKGRIDTVMRRVEWTAKDMCDEFGLENLPEKIQKAYADGKTQKYEVIHAVYPSKRVKGAVRGTKSFPFVSQYVLVSEKLDLKVEGFYELPYLTPRWSKLSGESYGRGPGEKALGPARTVNKMRETTLRGAQKVVDPPLQAPDDGFVLPLDTRPAGLNYYRAGSQDRIEAIFNDSRIDFGFQAIDQERAQIREAFYTDQLKLREGPQMTATEVSERVEQALRFLGPMLGRMQKEFLQPLVERLYKMCERQGLIPDAPAELKNKPLKVQYTSVMAMSQRLSEVQTIRRTMQEIAPFMSLDPAVADLFDTDASVRYIAKLTQLPQEMLRDDEVVKQIRAAKAQAQQEALKSAQQGEQTDQVSKLTTAAAKFQPPGAA